MSTWGQYKRKLRHEAKHKYGVAGAEMDPSCPKCGSPMYWRDAAGLTAMHPEGAWECSNQRCWHMLPPGELAPDTAPPHPDTGSSGLTLPEHWGRLIHKLAACGPNGCEPDQLPPEMDAAAGDLFAEAFRRAQTDGPDAAYQSMLHSLQMWPAFHMSFEAAKELADHWLAKYNSIFLGPDVSLGVPNDPRWSMLHAAMHEDDPYAAVCPQCGEPKDPETGACPSCGPELEALTTDNTDAGEIHILPSERSANGRHQVMVISNDGTSQWPTQYEPGRYGWDYPESVTTPTHIIDRAFEYARALDQTRGTRDAPQPNPSPAPNEYGFIPFHYPGQEQMDPSHPDPWMDNEPGTMTIPTHWGRRRRLK